MIDEPTIKTRKKMRRRCLVGLLILLLVLYVFFPMLLIVPLPRDSRGCSSIIEVAFAPVGWLYEHVNWYAAHLDFQREFCEGFREQNHTNVPYLAKPGWPVKAQGEVFSLPCASDGNLYFGACDGCLYRVNKESGLVKWCIGGFGRINSDPVTQDGVVYITPANSRVYAISCEDGSILWQRWVRGSSDNNPMLFGNSIAVVGRKRLVLFSRKNGEQLATLSLPGDGCQMASASNTIAVIVNSDTDSNNDTGKGALVCLEPDRGVTLWTTELGGASLGRIVCDETQCYVGSRNGTFCAIRMIDGSFAWQIDCNEIFRKDGTSDEDSGPVWADDYVISLEQTVIFSVSHQNIGAPAALVSVAKSSGQVLWSVEHSSQICGAFAVVGNRVFAVTEDRKILSVDADTGKYRTIAPLPNNDRGEFSGIINDGEHLFVSGADAHVWRLPLSGLIAKATKDKEMPNQELKATADTAP